VSRRCHWQSFRETFQFQKGEEEEGMSAKRERGHKVRFAKGSMLSHRNRGENSQSEIRYRWFLSSRYMKNDANHWILRFPTCLMAFDKKLRWFINRLCMTKILALMVKWCACVAQSVKNCCHSIINQTLWKSSAENAKSVLKILREIDSRCTRECAVTCRFDGRKY
jgi:hypothetical protein